MGHVNIGRYLFFYDLYKNVIELNGHIADVGTYKGASFIFMSKMVKLFEHYNTTQVHGFDWFQGMNPSERDDETQMGRYKSDYENLLNLIQLQDLQTISILHKMDIVTELDAFFQQAPHLRFKFVFIDCGIFEVMDKALEHFWPRLVTGGVLIMDHYNCEASPAESAVVDKYIGNSIIKQMPFNRQPTCYIIKTK